MKYVRIVNGSPEVVSLAQLMAENPNTSFPKDIPVSRLGDFGLYSLTVEPAPAFDPLQEVLEGPNLVPLSGTAYKQAYSVRALTTQEKEDAALDDTNRVTDNLPELIALGRATVDLVLALRDGQLDGLTKQQVLSAFRDRVLDYHRERRGL